MKERNVSYPPSILFSRENHGVVGLHKIILPSREEKSNYQFLIKLDLAQENDSWYKLSCLPCKRSALQETQA